MRTYINIIFLTFILIGCSNEIEQVNDSSQQIEVEEVSNPEIKVQTNTDPVNLENSEQEDLRTKDESIEGQNLNSSNSHEDQVEIMSVKDEVIKEISEKDFFTYYHDFQKTDDNKNSTLSFTEKLVYKVEEDAIYLPNLEDNKLILEGESYKVAAMDLEDNAIVTVTDEPISGAALIVVNLELLKELHPAISYSIFFENIEYELMVVEEDASLGIALIENSQLVLENLSKIDIMIMR